MACSVTTLLSLGKEFQKLSERDQLIVICELLCEISGGGGGTTAPNFTGSGSPEGVVTANPGSTYQQIDGGSWIATWIKQSGTGNTGWV